jgi:chitin disaccharide deacetylase
MFKIFKMKRLMQTFIILLWGFQSLAQKNLAESLGYPKDARLLIIHGDDVGVAHSENAATFSAMEKNGISSASIMVPCPWFPEVAAYAKNHPEKDWGIHLTLTAEWKNYKWGGVLPSTAISSLLNEDGFFYSSVEELSKHGKPEEVEMELRAQIKKALAAGIKLTHLDTHMGSVMGRPEYLSIYIKLGKEFQLPVLLPIAYYRMMPASVVSEFDTTSAGTLRDLLMADEKVQSSQWKGFYESQLKKLGPGLNELIFHLAYDDEEFRAVTIDHPDFGSAWRQRDYNYATSEEFKAFLKKENIHVITWGDVKKVMYKP